MTRTVTVAAQGVNLTDAFDQALGGWFTGEPIPPDAIQAAHDAGRRVFRFRLSVEYLDEVKGEPSPEATP